ncbi:MAG: tRNA-binding protein [Flavobacteriaceae bacterium]|jgi:tRNA-binding protein|nr:tRNA-binding protein [Flavobacteriaceae bacterium]MDA9630551.1 tRNA-binding protein [Flavobacteriaceae bacterium]MDB3967688.1 tRNA-binding protein [Flavobacteriaceae bacterium]
MIDYNTFEKIDLRVGTIISAINFPEANEPAFQLKIDFGPLGVLQSSAQITKRYSLEELLDRQVIAVVNIGTRKIANFESQCLVLGATEEKDVILLAPESKLANGQQIL